MLLCLQPSGCVADGISVHPNHCCNPTKPWHPAVHSHWSSITWPWPEHQQMQNTANVTLC